MRVVVYLCVGFALLLWVMSRAPGLILPSGAWLIIAALLAGVSARVPKITTLLSSTFERAGGPAYRPNVTITIFLGLLGTSLVLFSAWVDKRGLQPFWHDELSTVIQVQMLLKGRLWMPQHPLADFFETFHVLVKPVYASMYFPGGALALVPPVLFHFSTGLWTATLAGVYAGLTYRVMCVLTDVIWAVVATIMLMSLAVYRANGALFTSHLPATLLCMTGVWAWLRWRGSGHQLRWALVAGVALGWACVTRPADAAAYLLPLLVAVAWDLKRLPRLTVAKVILVGLAGALPFAALQLLLNVGVTGKYLSFPQDFLMRVDAPLPVVPAGAQFDPDQPVLKYIPRLTTELPQKQIFYHTFLFPLAWEYVNQSLASSFLHRRLIILPLGTVPHPVFLIFVPLGVVALLRERRPPALMLAAVLPIFFLTYAAWPYFLKHYFLPAAPAMIVIVVAGLKSLSDAWGSRGRLAGTIFLPVATILSCFTTLPGIGAVTHDQGFSDKPLRLIERTVAEHVQTPAVVLFRYSPSLSPHTEPVYNYGTAWPDDAPIIRAHDLGPRDVELFQYYGRLQPARRIYLYDRVENLLTYWGTAGELASRTAGH